MIKGLRRTTPALAAVLVAAGIAGCGNDVPGNSVAQVDDSNITRASFDHWIEVFARSAQGQQQGQTASATVPDAPRFTQCVATKKKNQPKPREGQARTTDAQLKRQCEQEYGQLRDQTVSFLIAAQWVQREAADQGVRVSDREVNKLIDDQRKQQFPKEADFRKALQDFGITIADLRYQTRVQQLQEKLVEKITKGTDRVSQQQIQTYYDKNKKNFAEAETRDLSIVLTRNRERAEAAKAALEDGQSFATVARRYSIDEASKSNRGKLEGVSRGNQEEAFDEAVFGAQRGELLGPIRTQFGFYVVRVDKVTAASQQSVKEATPAIRQTLQQENQQKAVNRFVEAYQKKWKERTNCRDGFVVQSCEGAPDQPRTQQAAAGAEQGGTAAPPPEG
jgi:foldase protein PrsA